jgi:hypothetical protein
MVEDRQTREAELVLAPGEYAYFRDETNGHIQTAVGPVTKTLSAQNRFRRAEPGRSAEDTVHRLWPGQAGR